MERKRRILIIDDEEDFCYFVKMNLEATAGFEVSVCCDSTEAVRQARKQQPDLILLDIMMPGMSGSDVAEELKNHSDTCDIPIVFSTALVKEEEIEEKNGVIGGRHFIAKPVKISELIDTINLHWS